jgi:hypothetical protein
LANLAMVVALAVLAALLLTKAVVDSRAARADIDDRITPRMVAVDTGLEALPVLDETGRATERIATRMLPLALALGKAADSSDAATAAATGMREDVAKAAKSLAAAEASAAGILESLHTLAPVVADIAAGTGDIRGQWANAQRQTAQAAEALIRVLARVRAVTGDVETLHARAREIEAVLRRVEGHARHAAGARALNCPADVPSCRP